jgi:hypothetical protein
MIQSIVYRPGKSARVQLAALIRAWQLRLGVRSLEARILAIDPLQVTGEDGLPGVELVGVVIERRRFTIVHTRPLDESDVVHELLHVAHPDWPHELVELWTDRLLLIAGVGTGTKHKEEPNEGSKGVQPAHAPGVHDHRA